MFDFSAWLDLPLIWGVLIATAIFIYVILDGFDLGCGIIFPFAPSEKCRDRMMNSIAPFWDGNETWLILGGAGLFVTFPLAYAVILSALYLPVLLMLIGLVFRGVAFEFRFKEDSERKKIWDICFHVGSLLATFMQGVILGNLVQGFEVAGRSYAGTPFAWANGFAIIVGVLLVFGYALLGATWLIMKTEDVTQQWGRDIARYVKFYVLVGMVLVSVCMPLLHHGIYETWFSVPNFYYLLVVPFITVFLFALLWRCLGDETSEYLPFILTHLIFLCGYIGIGVSIFPYIVPYHFTLWQAAAVGPSQSLTLVGTIIMLPIILLYTSYCYYVFRGKANHEKIY